MSESKVFLVTGCSSGIGRNLAVTLKQRGHKVYAAGRRWDSIKTLTELGVTPLQLDVTRTEDCERAVADIVKAEGRLDVVINNAGIAAMGPVIDLEDEQITEQLNTNVHAVIRMARAAAKPMIEQHSGLIVNVGSVSGLFITPFSGLYGASKAAVHAVSDALRMELAPFNINVMMVQPGAIQSDFGKNALHSLVGRHNKKSHYAPIEDAIIGRAKASQDKPTPTEEFSNALIKMIEEQPDTAVFRYGYGSTALSVAARWVPVVVKDWVLKRRFGLHKLGQ